MSRPDYKRILIVNPFGIGDVLFTTPLIRAFRRAYPNSYIAYLANRRTQDLVTSNNFIDEVFVYEKDEWKKLWENSKFSTIKDGVKFFARLKQRNFQVVVDLSLNSKFSFLFKMLGVKDRVGYNYKDRGRWLSKKIDLDGYEDKHVIEYYMDLLRFLKIPLDGPQMDLFLDPAYEKKTDKFLNSLGFISGKPLIAVVPGAGESWGRNAFRKRWSVERFAELSDKIIKELDAQVIIVGPKKERRLARQMCTLMEGKPLDASGRTTLLELTALLKKSDLIITNEGGPMHMAVALGAKCIAFFGPVDEKVYGPYPKSPFFVVIKKDLSCRPCYHHFKLPGCRYKYKCLNDITVEEVYGKVLDLTGSKVKQK